MSALLVTQSPSESRPQACSLEVLNNLLRLLSQELGRPPKFEEFYPIHLESIVESVLHWKLVRSDDLGSSPYGAQIMGRCDFEQKAILVRSQASGGAQRYSLAHEIGHALMHKDAPRCVGGSLKRVRPTRSPLSSGPRPEDYAIEREAERFAAELLMPAKAVRRAFQEVAGSPRLWSRSQLAEKALPSGELTIENVSEAISNYQPTRGKPLSATFGVTGAAMATRIRELGLVF